MMLLVRVHLFAEVADNRTLVSCVVDALGDKSEDPRIAARLVRFAPDFAVSPGHATRMRSE